MDLHGIDLNLLVAFDALMAERSVTKAGRRIGRTQPAMSAALSRLRRLWDDQLFVRGQDGLQPTPRALELSESLGPALDTIGRTLGFAQEFEPAMSRVTLNVALQEHGAFKLLPKLVRRLHEKAPATKLAVRAYTARDEAIALLDAGEADVAVGVPPSSAPGRIFVRPLFEEPYVCVVRIGHPAADGPLTLNRFLALEHLLVSPEGDRFGHTDTVLAERGLKRSLAITLTQMYAAPALVAGSDLIATLMLGVVDISGYADRLVTLEPPLPLAPCPYVMCWHRRNDAHPAQRWLRDCIVSVG
ncbi:LysR family transcriptional regulator [uncultured Sphingomonas sp.]|uniref:LysR family transcriptional regulator n=1 Tax=uncultured Sphingomonas sp. TaxID=158754 RepID=UPI0035CA887A